MSSESDSDHPPTAGGPRRRAKRVTAQHTLERVRNNQRRHRARRREYISTLEERLAEAERALAAAQNEVSRLKTELAACAHHHPHRTELSFQEADLPDLTPALASPLSLMMVDPAITVPEEGQSPGVGDEAPGLDVSAPEQESRTPAMPTQRGCCSSEAGNAQSSEQSCCCGTGPESNLNPTVSGVLAGMQIPKGRCILGRMCCSSALDDPVRNSSTFEFTKSLQSGQEMLPIDVLQSAMEAYCREHAEDESTTPCKEAQALISQQNFKGVSPEVIEKWLWDGFRKARGPGDSCRVQNTLLFSLLAFISDV